MKYENIMYKKRYNDEHVYCIPGDFSELKLLVKNGWCVMKMKEVDLFDFYRECDWFHVTTMHELKHEKWKDVPRLDIQDAMECEQERGCIYYNDSYFPAVIQRDDLLEDFENYLDNNSHDIINMLIQEHQDSWSEMGERLI